VERSFLALTLKGIRGEAAALFLPPPFPMEGALSFPVADDRG